MVPGWLLSLGWLVAGGTCGACPGMFLKNIGETNLDFPTNV